MSTYSPSLRIELITTGDQAGVWGDTTNVNLGTLIEAAITGYTSVSVTSANQALTALPGLPDEARNMVLALTTTTTAAFAVYTPPAEKTYVVYNASAYPATIYNSTVSGNTTAAGAGVTVPAGRTISVWTDGTNFAQQDTHLQTSPTGAIIGSAGTTAQRDGTPLTGYFRFNTTLNRFEGYDGAVWYALNPQTSPTGATISASGTTAERDGTPTAGYFRFNTTLSAFEGYNGSVWKAVGGGATGGGTDEVFVENGQEVTTDYTIPATRNAMSTGPITVNSGVTVTISSGSVWVVL